MAKPVTRRVKPKVKPKPKAEKTGGLSIKQLLKKVPNYILSKAKSRVVVKKYVPDAVSKGGYPAITAVCVDIEDSRRPHRQSIIGLDKSNDFLYNQRQVLVSCSCEFFMYYCEVALHHHGAAKIKYSNGKHPEVTNPTLYPLSCIAEGELVHTKRGLVPIQDVLVGDNVTTLMGYKRVLASSYTGRRKIYELKLTSGRTIRGTYDHPVYALENGKFTWVQLGQLKSNQSIVTIASCGSANDIDLPNVNYLHEEHGSSQKRPSKFPKKMTPQLARLLGYLVSDGCKSLFCNDDIKLHKDFRKLAWEIFGLKTETSQLGIIIHNALKEYGYVNYSWNQIIPDSVMFSSKECWAEFLCGAYAGDGYITDYVSTYATMNYELARQVQTLLFALGIHTTLGETYSGHAYTKMYLVRTSSVYETRKLTEAIKPIKKDKIKGEGEIGSKSLRFRIPGLRIKPILTDLISSKVDRYIDSAKNNLVRVASFCYDSDFGIPKDTVSSLLCKQGKVQKIRERKGGKPTYYAKVRDILEVSYDTIFSSMYRAIVGKRYNQGDSYGGSLNKDKIVSWIRKIPELRHSLGFLTKEEVIVDTVQSITPVGRSKVYDLTIKDAEHFVVNGVVVHNCKHLTALYRLILQRQD